MTLEQVLERFPDAVASGGSWKACCPAHDDSNPSLSISAGDDGRVLICCHAGCSAGDICSAVGLTMADLFPASTSTELTQSREKREFRRRDTTRKPRTVYVSAEAAIASLERMEGSTAGRWPYHDANGEAVGWVCRWDKPDGEKTFRQIALFPDGWRAVGMPEPHPLYRLPELSKPGRVFVCEGEKAADAARSIGLVATTSPGGAKAGKKADWYPLAGREVVILPDNDRAGREYAEDVAGILTSLAPPAIVRIVDLPGLPEKGDIVEWIELHENKDESVMRSQLESLVRSCIPYQHPGIDRPRTFQPFPTDSLPKPVSHFVVEGAKAIGCDPSFIALPILAVCAAAIGNSARLKIKGGWLVPPILWTMIVGESGCAKSPALRLVLKSVRERQRKSIERHASEMLDHQAELAWHKRKLSQWEKQKESSEEPPVRPEEPKAERFQIEDSTIEAVAPLLADNPRGLLLARDELSGWFGSFERYSGGKGGADAAHWLSMYGAETLTVDRKTGTPKTISVPFASMCITGGIQPGILLKSLGTEHRESGLAARFLFACPPRIAKQWTATEIDPEREKEFSEILDSLYDLPIHEVNGEPWRIFELSPEASAEYIRFYESHARETADHSGDMAAAWSKLEETPGRLALVIHLIRWAAHDSTLKSQDVVDLHSMRAAIQLTEWFKNEAARVYSLITETVEQRNQRKLVEWLARKGRPVTVREVAQGCRWLRASGMAENALLSLIAAGFGDWERSPSGQPGHPTMRFRLRSVNGTPTDPCDL